MVGGVIHFPAELNVSLVQHSEVLGNIYVQTGRTGPDDDSPPGITERKWSRLGECGWVEPEVSRLARHVRVADQVGARAVTISQRGTVGENIQRGTRAESINTRRFPPAQTPLREPRHPLAKLPAPPYGQVVHGVSREH